MHPGEQGPGAVLRPGYRTQEARQGREQDQEDEELSDEDL